MKPTMSERALEGRRVGVPETRELDLFARMLDELGAEVWRCPLVAIRDAPDPAPVEAWLRAFTDGSCDDLVLLTGEGLRRLVGFAERAGDDLKERFAQRLAVVRKVTRGPKPERALRELGLRSDLPAAAPTTDGVIETLATRDLAGRTVGVQLYGTDPNEKLIGFLERAGAAVRTVAPYVYADATDDAEVARFIEAIVSGGLDAVAFTSGPQVRRLCDVASQQGRERALRDGLARLTVAAIGPLTAEALSQRGIQADVSPQENYFMKPLVRSLVEALAPDGRG